MSYPNTPEGKEARRESNRRAADARKERMGEDSIKASNREYARRRREKTNNAYARAYRRAERRVMAWFQEHRSATWQDWLNEELAKEEAGEQTAAYEPTGSRLDGIRPSWANCSHDGDRYVIGIGVACSLCGKAIGEEPFPDEEIRTMVSDAMGYADYQTRNKRGQSRLENLPKWWPKARTYSERHRND